MNSNSTKDADVAQDGGDRLSSFHDSILCHILSFMPTKYAAKTSVLSRRWKHLFLEVPKVAFTEEDVKEDVFYEHETFINFVNRRLMLCKTHTSIAEFRLVLPKTPQLPAFLINLWVLTLLFRNLKVLQIEDSNCNIGFFAFFGLCTTVTQYLPREIIGWETLMVLKLRGKKMVLKFPRFVTFPNLNVLDLEHLELQSESESLRFDHQGYPLLEHLGLKYVSFNRSSNKDNKALLGLGIYLFTLKSLEIAVAHEFQLVRADVDTPGLRQLIWKVNEDVSPVQLSLWKCRNLMSADLCCEFMNPRGSLSKLLSNMNNVKDLQLTSFRTENLNCSLPHFANLSHLELKQTGVKSMLFLLQSTPNLEVLAHKMQDDDVHFVPPTDAPLCLALKLKEIKLSNFASEEEDDSDTESESDVVRLVRFFLQHGAVLEKLTLEHPFYVPKSCIASTLMRLLKIPHCSPKCEIEYVKEKVN